MYLFTSPQFSIKQIIIQILQICCNSHCFRFCLFFFFPLLIFFFFLPPPHSSFYHRKEDVARRIRTEDRRLQALGSGGAFPRVLAEQMNPRTIGFRWTPNQSCSSQRSEKPVTVNSQALSMIIHFPKI